jgi:hypothetical protein
MATGGGEVDIEALKQRIRQQLQTQGHLEDPIYRRDDPRAAAELASVDLTQFIAKSVALNRPREKLPITLERACLFRVPLVKRLFLRVYKRMFDDQRRINEGLLELHKLENDICVRLATRVVRLEREVAMLKEKLQPGESGGGPLHP